MIKTKWEIYMNIYNSLSSKLCHYCILIDWNNIRLIRIGHTLFKSVLGAFFKRRGLFQIIQQSWMYICVVGATRNVADVFVVICFWLYWTPYFYQGYSSYIFFLIFAHLWWFGVLELGSWVGLLRLRFSVYGVQGLWCGPSLIFIGLGLSIKK